MDLLQSHGGSMIMLAKGNRSQQVTDACHKHGGFYLGSIGGPAAVLAQQSIKHLECVAYPELGMEAIWKIEVEDFRRLSCSMTKVTTSSSKSSTNSARTALSNLFGPAPGSMLPGDPPGPPLCDCNFTLAGE